MNGRRLRTLEGIHHCPIQCCSSRVSAEPEPERKHNVHQAKSRSRSLNRDLDRQSSNFVLLDGKRWSSRAKRGNIQSSSVCFNEGDLSTDSTPPVVARGMRKLAEKHQSPSSNTCCSFGPAGEVCIASWDKTATIIDSTGERCQRTLPTVHTDGRAPTHCVMPVS